MKELAKNVTISVGGRLIAGGTDASLNLTTVFDTYRVKSDRREKRSASHVEWNIESQSVFGEEGNGLTGIDELALYAQKGTALLVEYKLGDLATFKGSAIISSYKETAPVEGRPTCSCTFRGVSNLIITNTQL